MILLHGAVLALLRLLFLRLRNQVSIDQALAGNGKMSQSHAMVSPTPSLVPF